MSAFYEKTRVRLLRLLAPSLLSWDDLRRPSYVVEGPGAFSAGAWTYWSYDSRFCTWKPDDSIAIGSFCSIAARAMLLAGGVHHTAYLSTYPMDILSPMDRLPLERPQSIRVGSDVWIGTSAIVLGDLTIGDGAVVGAGAVVTKDVDPYTVVAGVPARPIRRRLPQPAVEALLALRWWDWPLEAILEARPYLVAEDPDALLAFARARGLSSAGAGSVADEESDPVA